MFNPQNKRYQAFLKEKELERFEKEQDRIWQKKLSEERLEQRKRIDPELGCLLLLGEKSPGVDADSVETALVSALRYAKAYALDVPIRVGETSLLDLERRVYYESLRTKRPWLYVGDWTLSETMIELAELVPFDKAWRPLENSDVPVSAEQLNAALREVRGESAQAEPSEAVCGDV